MDIKKRLLESIGDINGTKEDEIRVREIAQRLAQNGMEVTPENVKIGGLFSQGGTITDLDFIQYVLNKM